MFNIAKAVKSVSSYFMPNAVNSKNVISTSHGKSCIDFEIAKLNCINDLKAHIKDIESLDYDQFLNRHAGGSIIGSTYLSNVLESSKTKVDVSLNHGELSLAFSGHGTFVDNDDSNSGQILIRQDHGEVMIDVFSDINSESPTHVICLSKSKLNSRHH